MTAKLLVVLDGAAEAVALVARVGSDLSRRRFEGEAPRFTHVALAVREGDGWQLHGLLNTAEGSEGHLYRQPPLHFFRDDPFEYRAAVLVPSRPLQQRLAAVVGSPLRERLHTSRYNRLAYPFSTRYQSSNQWVLELVAAAQGGGESRAEVQRHLAARDFVPDVLRTVGIAAQVVARYVLPNTRFDDHPLRDRLRGRIACVLEPSLRRHLRATDAIVAERVIGLGVPVGTPCPAHRLPGSQDVGASGFEAAAGRVVERLERGEDGPVGGWKPHHHEEAPDREHGAEVLRVREHREREPRAPGDGVAEPVTVEHADAAEALEDRDVEGLSDRDQRRARD